MSETAKKKSSCRTVLTVVCVIVGVVLLILLAARLYFRIPVHEYYANSEKTFVMSDPHGRLDCVVKAKRQ